MKSEVSAANFETHPGTNVEGQCASLGPAVAQTPSASHLFCTEGQPLLLAGCPDVAENEHVQRVAAANEDGDIAVHAPSVVGQCKPGFGRNSITSLNLATSAILGEPAVAAPTANTTSSASGASPDPVRALSERSRIREATQLANTEKRESVSAEPAREASRSVTGARVERPKLSSESLWKEVTHPASGRVYYYHTITKESVWRLPTIETLERETESSFMKFFSRLKNTAGFLVLPPFLSSALTSSLLLFCAPAMVYWSNRVCARASVCIHKSGGGMRIPPPRYH